MGSLEPPSPSPAVTHGKLMLNPLPCLESTPQIRLNSIRSSEQHIGSEDRAKRTSADFHCLESFNPYANRTPKRASVQIANAERMSRADTLDIPKGSMGVTDSASRPDKTASSEVPGPKPTDCGLLQTRESQGSSERQHIAGSKASCGNRRLEPCMSYPHPAVRLTKQNV